VVRRVGVYVFGLGAGFYCCAGREPSSSRYLMSPAASRPGVEVCRLYPGYSWK
jgi:hypothetical protein